MSIRASFNLVKKVTELKAGELADRFRDTPHAATTEQAYGLTFGGMVSFEETPFILMENKGIQLGWPGEKLLIQAYGSYSIEDQRVHRYYLSDGKSFIQAVSSADGEEVPGELRLFRQYDEVNPASEEEWDFWLAEEDGYIGYPQFQSADGQLLYERIWSPGDQRIEPFAFTERVRTAVAGTQTLNEHHQAMLYGRYAPEPAEGEPPDADADTELLLVSAVESADEAWVEIHVGVGLNPEFLQVL